MVAGQNSGGTAEVPLANVDPFMQAYQQDVQAYFEGLRQPMFWNAGVLMGKE